MLTESGSLQDFELYRRCAGTNHTDFPGRGIRELEHALLHKWPTISDGHGDGATIAEIRHPQAGSERQGAMGCGQLVHIEALATCREAAMMRISIPRGHTPEGMGGLFTAPKHIEADQPDESHDAKRTLTQPPPAPSPSRGEGAGGGAMAAHRTRPAMVIAQARQVLYHCNTRFCR